MHYEKDVEYVCVHLDQVDGPVAAASDEEKEDEDNDLGDNDSE